MKYSLTDIILCPFILMVGKNITKIEVGDQLRFLKQQLFCCGIGIIPSMIFGQLLSRSPYWIYWVGEFLLSFFAGAAAVLYVYLIFVWRAYLKRLTI